MKCTSFFLGADTINTAFAEVAGKSIKEGKGMGIKVTFTSCKTTNGQLKNILQNLKQNCSILIRKAIYSPYLEGKRGNGKEEKEGKSQRLV